jgi:cag pathogenicity island protein 12
MKKIIIFTFIMFIFVGCGRKEPVKLDNDSAITINQELIRLKNYNVPLDSFLKNNSWTYNMYFSKINDELINDDEVVKAFYLAHNADEIIIIGANPVALEYQSYFLKNQVLGKIRIHEVDSINGKKNLVNVLFFGKKREK